MNVINPFKIHAACQIRESAVRNAASAVARKSQRYNGVRNNYNENFNNKSSASISIPSRSYHSIIGSIESDKENVETNSTKVISSSRVTMMAHSHHQYQHQHSFLPPLSVFALYPASVIPSNAATAIITRSFSTGHPPTNNANENNNGKHKIRKHQIQNAAKRGGVAVKKGALSIKDMIQKYGWTFLGTYFTIYAITLGSLFASLDTGLIDPTTLSHVHLPWHSGAEAVEQDAADAEEIVSAIDMVAKYMKKYSWTEPYADLVKRNPHTSNLAIAWVATKLTEPVRIGVTLAIVPRIWKILGNKEDVDSDSDENFGDDLDNHITRSENAAINDGKDQSSQSQK